MKRWIADISKNKLYNNFAQCLYEIGKKKSERKIKLLGEVFIQYPDVFPADAFEDTEFFTKEISAAPNEHFLEIGIGTGITAIMMAKQGAKVVGVDVNERAVENAKKNAKLHNVEANTDFYVSDIFSKVPKQTFDTIYWNVPFCYSEIKELNNLQKSTFDYYYYHLETFFKESKTFLKQGGRLLVGFSNELGVPAKLMQYAYDSNFTNIKMLKRSIVEWKSKKGETKKWDLTLYEFLNK